jgi:hypothetical protein
MWLTNRRTWSTKLAAERADLDEQSGEAFGAAMWDDGEFVVSVTRDFVRSCPTALAVLPGVDAIHPYEIGREVAELAPNALLIDPWKDTPENVAAATAAIRDFLATHAEG